MSSPREPRAAPASRLGQQGRFVALWLAVALPSLAAAGNLSALFERDDEAIATLVRRDGEVAFRPADLALWEPVGSDQAFYEDQIVATGPDGHASLRLAGGRSLQLDPGSQVTLSRQQDSDALGSLVTVLKGSFRVDSAPAAARHGKPQGVLLVRAGDETIRLASPDGAVRIEKDVRKAAATIAVMRGEVSISSPRASEPIVLHANDGDAPHRRTGIETWTTHPDGSDILRDGTATEARATPDTSSSSDATRQASGAEARQTPASPYASDAARKVIGTGTRATSTPDHGRARQAGAKAKKPPAAPRVAVLPATRAELRHPRAGQRLWIAQSLATGQGSVDLVFGGNALPVDGLHVAVGDEAATIRSRRGAGNGAPVIAIPIAKIRRQGKLVSGAAGPVYELRLRWTHDGASKVPAGAPGATVQIASLVDASATALHLRFDRVASAAGSAPPVQGLGDGANFAHGALLLTADALARLAPLLRANERFDVAPAARRDARGVVLVSKTQPVAVLSSAAGASLVGELLGATLAYTGTTDDLYAVPGAGFDAASLMATLKASRLLELHALTSTGMIRVSGSLVREQPAAARVIVQSARAIFKRPVEVIPLAKP